MNTIFEQFKNNWKSGISVAIVSIPLSIPLAVASGGSPIQGIITAIWAGLFASLFGGSAYNIVGPAGALSGLLLVFTQINGPELLPILAIVTGIFILLIYSLKITKYLTLIPSTALHGFIMGVGLIIAATQLNNALGLTGLTKHEGFLGNLWETILNIPQTNLSAFGIFIVGLAILLIWKKYIKTIPGLIPVSILGILLGYLTKSGYIDLSFLTLSDIFPNLSFSLVLFNSTIFQTFFTDIELMKNVLFSGFVIAVVALLETIISAKIADKTTKTSFNQNKEIFGLALANIASGLAGGMTASGVFVRTAVNMKSGAKSSYSQFISSISILLISWLLFSFFKFLPMPIVAAILMNVALGMIDITLFKKIYHYSPHSLIVLLIVGIITLVEDPILGIVAGTSISLLLFLKHSSDGHIYTTVFRNKEFFGKMYLKKFLDDQKTGDIVICKFSGEINFICISAELEQLKKIKKGVTIIFSFSRITHIDIDGIETLEEILEYYSLHGIQVYFTGVDGELATMFHKTEYYHQLHGEKRVYESSSLLLNELLG